MGRSLRVRDYGRGRSVFLLHGGPGASGYLAPVAEPLSDSFRVIEPFQRGSGDEPLTVATHVDDLRDLIDEIGDERPAIVGHSWGAMLALAFAAAFPERAGPIVLIGCGTFDPVSRAQLQRNREARMGAKDRARLASLADEIEDSDERLRRAAELALPLDSFELAECKLPVESCDARAYRETWGDVLRLQEEGVHPAAFARIDSPVLMIHGVADPHPGTMIRDNLAQLMPQLQYHELRRCGHYPWLERHAREEFFVVLRDWLAQKLGARSE